MDIPVKERDFSSEFIFRTSRSSGSGGQHVNKVSTRVELVFFVDSSALLTAEEKKIIFDRLKTRIRSDGAIHLSCQERRYQYANKKKVIERFYALLAFALKPVKKRLPSTISEEALLKRKTEKIRKSRKKKLRQKPTFND